MNSPRYLITGGTSGSGKSLLAAFGNSARGIGRGDRFDITDAGIRSRIAELSLEFEVFVNHACSNKPFSQVELLEEVFSKWKKVNHQGYIVSTGSYSTYSLKPHIRLYTAAKLALDTYSRQCSKWCENHPGTFRVSIIRPGILDSERSRAKPSWPGYGVDMQDYAKLIQFLTTQPTQLLVPDLVLSSRDVAP